MDIAISEQSRRGRPVTSDKKKIECPSTSKEYRREAMRKYRLKYPERVKSYTKKYFDKPFDCECGKSILMKSKFSHLKSRKHRKIVGI